MYRNILLCTDGSDGANSAADYASDLAKRLGAQLTALYVIDVRLLEGPLLADIAGAIGAQPYAALVPRLQEVHRERAESILKATRERCQQRGVACHALHRQGDLIQVLLELERDADLVVIGQRGENAAWHGDQLGSSVERMVRASIKPCLVTPTSFRAVQRLLLAFDGSDESRKALRAGLDLAADLSAHLTITTVCEDPDEENTASAILDEARQQAAERKVPVDTHLAQGHAEDQILAQAQANQADLIVMGAYGHTRIREWILGSTTSQVLQRANQAVLLCRGNGTRAD